MPESVVLILPNETPATEVMTDDGPLQVQPATGEVAFTPTTATAAGRLPTAVTSTQGAAQTLPVVATAADPLVPLDPAATRLEAPAGATVDADGTVVVVPGEGRYELDRTAGTVLFTPVSAFTGTATPVPYVVTDAAGATAASTLTPSVTKGASLDTSTGEQDTPQRLAVTENDGGTVPVSPATLPLVDPAGVDAATVVLPGEGTWTVDGEELVFTPEAAFVGTHAQSPLSDVHLGPRHVHMLSTLAATIPTVASMICSDIVMSSVISHSGQWVVDANQSRCVGSGRFLLYIGRTLSRAPRGRGRDCCRSS
ncbi:hypothetical protein ASG05_08750 [Frigoribacterium sp. Leaf186]|nr:hypothetical protein ASG05_08750 [Frigoribacterium sp. Leaf186]